VTEFVLAVDGGGVKTDLALVETTGSLVSLVRGGPSSPHYIGVDGCTDLLGELLAAALVHRGVGPGPTRAALAEIMIAGADLPEELALLRSTIEARGWARELVIDNDTCALLRSGTDRGWGIAVVCGGGINCVGLAPDGREARFDALGPISGDWGGGSDIGVAALMAATRSADGRGPRSALESAVPAYFDMAEPLDVARAVHLGEIGIERLGELTRIVFAAAADDAAAAAIADRLGDEVVAFAAAAIRCLELADDEPDVVLGGGVLRTAPRAMLERVETGIHAVAPRANVSVAQTAPVVGAALLGLDRLGAGPAAAARARSELHAAFLAVEADGARITEDGRAIAVGPAGHLATRTVRG
jgi:N-acetylglucosamine kinase-like BadF-type ATPase